MNVLHLHRAEKADLAQFHHKVVGIGVPRMEIMMNGFRPENAGYLQAETVESHAEFDELVVHDVCLVRHVDFRQRVVRVRTCITAVEHHPTMIFIVISVDIPCFGTAVRMILRVVARGEDVA